MSRPRLLAITPPAGPVDLEVVQAWSEAGATAAGLAVLLREPGASPQQLVDPDGRLGELAAACRAASVPLLLSCDAAAITEAVTLVRTEGLTGIQVRGDPSEEHLDRARTRLREGMLGRSCHGEPQAGHAFVDYTCVAPIFAPRTLSQNRDKAPAGLELLRRWTADPAAWIVALGGIEPSTAEACVRAGARGLASISTFFGAPAGVAQDVAAVVSALRTG